MTSQRPPWHKPLDNTLLTLPRASPLWRAYAEAITKQSLQQGGSRETRHRESWEQRTDAVPSHRSAWFCYSRFLFLFLYVAMTHRVTWTKRLLHWSPVLFVYTIIILVYMFMFNKHEWNFFQSENVEKSSSGKHWLHFSYWLTRVVTTNTLSFSFLRFLSKFFFKVKLRNYFWVLKPQIAGYSYKINLKIIYDDPLSHGLWKICYLSLLSWFCIFLFLISVANYRDFFFYRIKNV